MPQGPVLLPALPQQPSGQLSQKPLRETNPVLSDLKDFLLSALGVSDGLGPDASNAAILGVGAGALFPLLGSIRKSKTAEQAISEASAAVAARQQGIKAYHGSPHDFDQFSLSKIGTGEGAQAYGHGLYFAENPDVAAEYKRSLSIPQRTVEGRPVNRSDPREFAANLLRTFEGKHSDPRGIVLSELKSDIANPNLLEPQKEFYRKVVKEIESGAPLPKVDIEDLGKTYEVSLNASPDDFLDWDKPLSQQSEKVRKAVSEVFTGNAVKNDPIISELFDEGTIPGSYMGMFDNSKGAQVYNTLAKGNPAQLSDSLKQVGVKGIRYLDQGSRDPQKMKELADDLAQYREAAKHWAATGNAEKLKIATKQIEVLEQRVKNTSNYVVFDDAIIAIMKKYGIALPVAAAGLKAQQERRERLAMTPSLR